MLTEGDKLYVITRADLAPGYQAVQAMHALREFAAGHPDVDREWYERSNYLALLAVRDEDELARLATHAAMRGIKLATFREPDIDDALTAVALEPCSDSRKLCAKLPLALDGV